MNELVGAVQLIKPHGVEGKILIFNFMSFLNSTKITRQWSLSVRAIGGENVAAFIRRISDLGYQHFHHCSYDQLGRCDMYIPWSPEGVLFLDMRRYTATGSCLCTVSRIQNFVRDEGFLIRYYI